MLAVIKMESNYLDLNDMFLLLVEVISGIGIYLIILFVLNDSAMQYFVKTLSGYLKGKKREKGLGMRK